MLSTPGKSPRIVASSSDPARAEAVNDEEYATLTGKLDTVVMPMLNIGFVRLKERGFVVLKYSRCGGLASMIVRHTASKVSGWIYFQVHQTFAPLVGDQRIFWMYSYRRDGGAGMGAPGRLQNLDDRAPIAQIVALFVAGCEVLANPPWEAPATGTPG